MKNFFKQQSLKNFVSSDWDYSEAGSSVITLQGFPKEFRTRKLIKYSERAKAIKALFGEYCDNSTIHGIRYLGEEKRPIWERAFWIFVFCLSIFCCSKLIHNIWVKWDQNPVIVSFSEKSTPVWNIPFPAITICPEAKTQQEIFNFTNVYSKLYKSRFKNGTMNLDNDSITRNESDYLRAMLQVCSTDFVKDLKFPKYLEPINIMDLLTEVSPTFNETYPFCKFKNVISLCEDLEFSKVYTDDGVCYSFNSLQPFHIYREHTVQYKEFMEENENGIDNKTYNLKWNLEDGYSIDAGTNAYPHRVFSPYFRGGFFMILQGYNQNTDYICKGIVKGFRVLLHSPDDAPYITKNYIRIPFNKEILIRINPNIIQTSEGLRYLSPLRRQCYFSHERHLQFFKIYSQANCELECLANITLRKCQCVKFSMPRDDETPVCDESKILCYNEAEEDLLKLEFEEGHRESTHSFRGETTCNCLPACTSLVYEAEISQAKADFEKALDAYNESHFKDEPGIKMTRLSIFFKESQYITSRRSELYGMTDFLANSGGLLALFMGVSALSLVEIIYYCSVRLTTNIQMRRHGQKVFDDLTKVGMEMQYHSQFDDLFDKTN